MLIQYDQFVKDTFFLCQYVIFIKIMTDFFSILADFIHFGNSSQRYQCKVQLFHILLKLFCKVI